MDAAANGNPDNPDLSTLIRIVEAREGAEQADTSGFHQQDAGNQKAAQRIPPPSEFGYTMSVLAQGRTRW
jgi:hypothetical protein